MSEKPCEKCEYVCSTEAEKSTCPYQPKSEASTLIDWYLITRVITKHVPCESVAGEGMRALIVELVKEQDAHTRQKLIEQGWKTPEEVAEIKQEWREREADWLERYMNGECGDCEAINCVNDCEGIAGIRKYIAELRKEAVKKEE